MPQTTPQWKDEEKTILENYLASWQTAPRSKRVEIGGKAWEEIKLLHSFENEKAKKSHKSVSERVNFTMATVS